MRLADHSLSSLALLCDLLFALVLCFHCQQAQAQNHDETLKQRFLKEAPSAWAEYARHAEKLQGSSSYNHVGTAHDVKHHDRAEYKRNRNGKLLVISSEHTTKGKRDYGGEEAYGVNPKYAFRLQRKSSASPWVVVQIEDLSKTSVPENIARRFDQMAAGITRLVRVEETPLFEILRRPDFQVLRCQTVSREGEELVEIVFSYPHKVEQAPLPYVQAQSGSLLLDPKRFWCLRSCDLKAENGTITSRVKELSDSGGSFPIPKCIETENNWIFTKEQIAKGFPPKNKQQMRWDYDLSEPDRLPDDSEFTLTAFGLPEPPGLEWRKPTPWYLWLALAGGFCLLLGVLFAWLKRRRSAATT